MGTKDNVQDRDCIELVKRPDGSWGRRELIGYKGDIVIMDEVEDEED